MKRIILSIIALIFNLLTLNSQQLPDTLYLKNSSVVWGKILEKTQTHYSVRTTDGLIFTFPVNEVDRFVFGHKIKKDLENWRPEGIGFTIQSGTLFGSGNVSFILFSFTPMLTYTINRIHSISAGIGYERYENKMMPLFAEYKVNFSKKRQSPFCYVKGGALFNLEADEGSDYSGVDNKTGSTFGTGLGISWPYGRFDSYIQLGYRYSHIKTVHIFRVDDIYIDKLNLNRLDITCGFKF
ncbi:MAG: hypothetical protein MUF36_06395 [Bacteroidales bacterium]|jgi:hypothetical protein|nr:hypothetical protein [Bacteroidales bacterium]